VTGEVHVLLVTGSTRGASTNTATLRTARLVAPEGVTAVLFDGLADLPAFNPDADEQAPHDAVRNLRRRLAVADAVLFCTAARPPGRHPSRCRSTRTCSR